MNTAFSGQILAEKLSKLNNSQQSIESLSQWCISHRKRAKQVVETWDKLFNNSQREKRVSFLYLANDILQNSRRKGSEFVNEFWKFLPAALKDVFENSDEAGKNAASRLVDIWDERKVFGSRGRSLKDEMLGKEAPPSLENNGKSLNPIKIVKKDAHSLRIKLVVGGAPEKIVSAFHSIHDEQSKEDTALHKCEAAVCRMEKIEKDVENSSIYGNQQVLSNELQEQEDILRHCIEQLESVETTRISLIGQLKEVLQDQESKLEHLHAQLQVARAQIEQASILKQRLSSSPSLGPSPLTAIIQSAETCGTEAHTPYQVATSDTMPQPPLPQPMTSFVSPRALTEDENKKAAAAAVAAKLAAMTSSAQMLTSVLSSLAAEEAASVNGGLKPGGLAPSNPPLFPPEKRPKLEKPMPVSDIVSSTYFTHGLQNPLSSALPTPSQTTSQASQTQHQYPPPPPSQPPPPVHSYVQSNNMMMGGMSYGYGANGLPPPPPLPTHMMMGLVRPGSQQQQQQQPMQPPQSQKPQPPQQQATATGGYYQSSGIGFYSSHQQQAAPPLPRQ